MPNNQPGPSSPFLYHRPKLASETVDALMGQGPFNHASGLFLAAPRRTGKSTFMRTDLIPALEDRGVTTTYVDLWADRERDPASLIADALATALRKLDSGLTKAIRKSGLTKLGIAGALTFDIDRIGQPNGATLTEAFRAIVARTGKPVAFILDEAQQALATPAGIASLFALKAARDALNQDKSSLDAPGPSLMLVFTGSHRDKLASIVLKRDQPFYGADITDFPKLGRDYTDAYTAWLNPRLAAATQLDPAQVWEAFQAIGHRPEMLDKVLKDVIFRGSPPTYLTADLTIDLADSAIALRERMWQDYDNDVQPLSTLQKAVLTRLIHEGPAFAPFTTASLAVYTAMTRKNRVTAAQVQAALDALRHKNIVWRNARGAYTLEDQDMAAWFLARNPPQP